MNVKSIIRRLVAPLRSRKVRVALTTVLAAMGLEFGIGVDEEVLLTIVGVGAALILGIAHEDNGRARAATAHHEP